MMSFRKLLIDVCVNSDQAFKGEYVFVLTAFFLHSTFTHVHVRASPLFWSCSVLYGKLEGRVINACMCDYVSTLIEMLRIVSTL